MRSAANKQEHPQQGWPCTTGKCCNMSKKHHATCMGMPLVREMALMHCRAQMNRKYCAQVGWGGGGVPPEGCTPDKKMSQGHKGEGRDPMLAVLTMLTPRENCSNRNRGTNDAAVYLLVTMTLGQKPTLREGSLAQHWRTESAAACASPIALTRGGRKNKTAVLV